jgi:hypothetical protein
MMNRLSIDIDALTGKIKISHHWCEKLAGAKMNNEINVQPVAGHLKMNI